MRLTVRVRRAISSLPRRDRHPLGVLSAARDAVGHPDHRVHGSQAPGLPGITRRRRPPRSSGRCQAAALGPAPRTTSSRLSLARETRSKVPPLRARVSTRRPSGLRYSPCRSDSFGSGVRLPTCASRSPLARRQFDAHLAARLVFRGEPGLAAPRLDLGPCQVGGLAQVGLQGMGQGVAGRQEDPQRPPAAAEGKDQRVAEGQLQAQAQPGRRNAHGRPAGPGFRPQRSRCTPSPGQPSSLLASLVICAAEHHPCSLHSLASSALTAFLITVTPMRTLGRLLGHHNAGKRPVCMTKGSGTPA